VKPLRQALPAVAGQSAVKRRLALQKAPAAENKGSIKIRGVYK